MQLNIRDFRRRSIAVNKDLSVNFTKARCVYKKVHINKIDQIYSKRSCASLELLNTVPRTRSLQINSYREYKMKQFIIIG